MKLPHDWSEFFASLTSHRVRFLIVGAHALAAHGRPRATQDLDVWVEPTEANASRLGAALGDFGFPGLARSWRRLARAERMVTLGVPPLQIDIMTSITGVAFRDAWRRRVTIRFGDHEVPFLCRADLVSNKQSTGRAKDLLDIELLKEASPRGRR